MKYLLSLLLFSSVCLAQGTFPQDVSLSGDTTLSSSHMNHLVLGTGGAGGITLTLPANSSWHNSYTCFIKVDSAAGTVTLARAGSDTINGATTYVIQRQYDSVCLFSNGAGLWEVASMLGSTRGLGATFDGGGFALTTGTAYVTAPVGCTITTVNILVDQGTATFTVWKVATGTALPTVSNTISTSGIAISSGTALRTTTVSDFTSVAITAGDILGIHLNAVSSATWAQYSIECRKM